MAVKYLQDGKAEHRKPYEWKSASVNVSGTSADTDITGISGFTTLFDTVPVAHRITVESSGTAYIRLNSATNDVITVTATTPYTDNFSVTTALYVSTNGGAVTITVKLR